MDYYVGLDDNQDVHGSQDARRRVFRISASPIDPSPSRHLRPQSSSAMRRRQRLPAQGFPLSESMRMRPFGLLSSSATRVSKPTVALTSSRKSTLPVSRSSLRSASTVSRKRPK